MVFVLIPVHLGRNHGTRPMGWRAALAHHKPRATGSKLQEGRQPGSQGAAGWASKKRGGEAGPLRGHCRRWSTVLCRRMTVDSGARSGWGAEARGRGGGERGKVGPARARQTGRHGAGGAGHAASSPRWMPKGFSESSRHPEGAERVRVGGTKGVSSVFFWGELKYIISCFPTALGRFLTTRNVPSREQSRET